MDTVQPVSVFPLEEYLREFPNLPHRQVLSKDYPYKKLLTLKYKGRAPSFGVNAKGSIAIKQTAEQALYHQISIRPAAETKFCANYQGVNFQAKFNNEGTMRLWTGWSQYSFKQHPVALSTVLKTETDFSRFKAYLLATYTTQGIQHASRLQLNRMWGNQYSIAHRIMYSKGRFSTGAYANLDLRTMFLTQYNGIAGYKFDKRAQIYAEHETIPSKTFAKPALGRLHLTAVYKEKRYQSVVQLTYSCPKKKFSAKFGGVYRVDEKTSIRARIDDLLDVAFGARYKLSDHLSAVIGASASLKENKNKRSNSSTSPIPFGVQLEFTF